MAVITPNNENTNKQGNKKKYLMIFAILLVLFNLVFGIWYFSAEEKKYYNDKDGDGFGNIEDFKDAKIRPWGFVDDNTDTDDNNPCVPDSTTAACLGQKAPTPDDSTTASKPQSDTSSFSAGGGSSNPELEIITPPIESLKVYYEDSDGDGFGDPNGVKEFAVDDKPFDYVSNNKDACPTRKGPSSNKGCPEYQISLPSEGFVGENFDVKIVDGILEPGDKVNWIADSNIKKITSARELEAMGQIVGMYKISAELSNSDGFEMSLSNKTIFLKIRPNVLADMFRPFYIYGSALSAKATNVSVLKNNADVAKVDLKKHIKDGILSGANVYDNTGGIVNDLETFISADIIGGAVKGGLKVSKVKYSTKTGKITEIHIQ